MNQALLEFIRETVTPENMKLQEPMAAHTTFRTGGEAAVFVEVPGKYQDFVNIRSQSEGWKIG